RDLVLLHKAGNAGIQLPGHLAAALYDLGEVERRLIRREAVGVGMGDIMIDLGRTQQRLRGDAAPVEADAAELLALHDRSLEAKLRGADRRDITAGAGAENDQVVTVCHGCFPDLPATG